MINETKLQAIKNQEETAWINPYKLPAAMTNAISELVVSDEDIEDARKRLERFASYIKVCFPETEETGGLIESPLVEIPSMQVALEDEYGVVIPGSLYLKMDSHLAIAGSVKARGGIYEVLKHAEDLAIESGRFSEDMDYALLAGPEWKEYFGQYTIQVGSTGNLGLSIGIMSAALGFRVIVHMSSDARQWKKDLLRSKGVEVIEYADDYSRAVAEGRRLSDADPMSYFVDDEKSVNLFLGYAVAAGRLKDQLEKEQIKVDGDHPLIVYIPAGVGGAPGGVAYGLKRIWGDQVHCFFVEPTLCPSVLLGIATQKFEKANVHDFGIHGLTEADGLACASPSGFVTRIMTNQLSGEFTVGDAKLYEFLELLYSSEQILIEPSSCAVFAGPRGLWGYDDSRDYLKAQGLTFEKLEKCTQIAWATGGKLVPESVWAEYLEKAGV